MHQRRTQAQQHYARITTVFTTITIKTLKNLQPIMRIQSNSSGTRTIEVSEAHLQTIDQYQLFRDLIDSNGYVDEQVLDKLRLNIRSLLEGDAGKDKKLLDLCLDVIYHQNMKAFGLQQLVLLFINWKNQGNDGLGMTIRAVQGTPFN
jgi:hypothetical protein